MMLIAAERPPFQSFFEGPSTVFCVAVYEWMVVMRPSSMPKPSFRSTWTSGARQFVVQEALEMIECFERSRFESLTPMTSVMSSPFAGAEMMTFLAPAARWPFAFSASVKRPVDSITSCTPSFAHGNSAGVFALTTRISLPLTINTSSSALSGEDFFEVTVPANFPCVESYLTR